jgi:hypothetical protein
MGISFAVYAITTLPSFYPACKRSLLIHNAIVQEARRLNAAMRSFQSCVRDFISNTNVSFSVPLIAARRVRLPPIALL